MRGEVAGTITIKCPPELVFGTVMSPELAPVIDPAVREWRPDREPIGVGTRFSIRAKLAGLPTRGVSEMAVWEPPHRAELVSVRPRWIRIRALHEFLPEDGATRYTWRIWSTARGRPGHNLQALLLGVLERTIAAQQARLKRYLEEESGASRNPSP